MKKILAMLLLLSVCVSIVSCGMKLNDEKTFDDVRIEHKIDLLNQVTKATYYVTPTDFDFEALIEGGYKMEITASFELSYEKTWGIGDFGYFGAPQYDVSILDKNGVGESRKAVTIQENNETVSVKYTANVKDLVDNSVVLTLSSGNIQNVVFFKNIVVSYRCVR